MTDRELLELAAKAAGYGELNWITFSEFPRIAVDLGGHIWWNPLLDDGDALRLAVRLNEFEPYKSRGGFRLSPGLTLDQQRHAIVRAAAEIGKTIND